MASEDESDDGDKPAHGTAYNDPAGLQDDGGEEGRRRESLGSDDISPVPSDVTRDEAGLVDPFWKQRRANQLRFQAEGSDEPRRVEDPSRPDILDGLDRPHDAGALKAVRTNSDGVPSAFQSRGGPLQSCYEGSDDEASDEEHADEYPEDEDEEEDDEPTDVDSLPEDEVKTPTDATSGPDRAPHGKDPSVHERNLKLVGGYATVNGRRAFNLVLQIRLMRAVTQIRQPASRDQYQNAYECAVSGLHLAKSALDTDAGQQDIDTLSKTVAQSHYYAGLAAYLAGPNGFERALEHLRSSRDYAAGRDAAGRIRAEKVINNILQYQHDPTSVIVRTPDQQEHIPESSKLAWLRGTFGSISSAASSLFFRSPYEDGVVPQGQRLDSQMLDRDTSPGQSGSLTSVSAVSGAVRKTGSGNGSTRSIYIPPHGVSLGISTGTGLYSVRSQTGSSASSPRSIPMAKAATKRMTISIGSTNSSKLFPRPMPQRTKTAPSAFSREQASSAKFGAASSNSRRTDRTASRSPGSPHRSPKPESVLGSENPSNSSSRSGALRVNNSKQHALTARPVPIIPTTIAEELGATSVEDARGPKPVKMFSNYRFSEAQGPPGEGSSFPKPNSPDFPWSNLPYKGYLAPNEQHPEYQRPLLIGYHDGENWVESEAEGETIWWYYKDVKVKQLVEKGPGERDKNGHYFGDGLKWSKKTPWTAYHPLVKSPKTGDTIRLTQEPDDYPQGFYEAGFMGAQYAEPYDKRVWRMEDFVKPVRGLGLDPDYIEGQQEDDGEEDDAIRDAGEWQQKTRMAGWSVFPKVEQIFQEFAQETMRVMLETLTREEMFEYCHDVNRALLKRKAWDIMRNLNIEESEHHLLSPTPPASQLPKAKLAVVNISPASLQMPATPKLTNATPVVINRSSMSTHTPFVPRLGKTPLTVDSISAQESVPIQTPQDSETAKTRLANTIVSPRESSNAPQTPPAPRSPKAKIAVVNKTPREPTTPPQECHSKLPQTPSPAPSESEAEGAARGNEAEGAARGNESPIWSKAAMPTIWSSQESRPIPNTALLPSIFSPRSPTSYRPKSISWDLRLLLPALKHEYSNKSSPTSLLAHSPKDNSPLQFLNSSPHPQRPASLLSTAHSPSAALSRNGSSSSSIHHRRKSSIFDTLSLLTGTSRLFTSSAEDAAERGESPGHSPAGVEGGYVGHSPARVEGGYIGVRGQGGQRSGRSHEGVVRQRKMLEELMEEGVAPREFREEGKRKTF